MHLDTHPLSEKGNSQLRAGVTEILLPNTHLNRFQMLLPMLAYLSRNASDDKWFTWITPSSIDKHHLEQHNFKLENIQLIHSRSSEECLWALWESLRSGRSSVVVASCEGITKGQYASLNAAARCGDTQGLVISYPLLNA